MKAFRSTAVLTLFVVLIAGYTAWEYKKASRNEGLDAAQERKLFTLNNEDVTQVQLTRPAETILLHKVNGEWLMKQPVEDQADGSAMDSFLYSALSLKGKVFRSDDESKATNWAEFGLAPPGTTMEFKGEKKTETVAVSSKNAYDGSFYLRQGDDLLLGDRGVAQVAPREANSFRTKKLWREGDLSIERVDSEINEGTWREKFSLHKEGDKWILQPSPAFAVNETRLGQWVKAVQALTATDIAHETPTEEDKRNALMLKPSLVVIMHYKKADGTKSEWKLLVGQDKAEDVFVQTDLRPTVYKLQRSALSSIRVPKEYFRDGKKAFQFPVEQATSIQVANGAFKHSFQKESGATAWNLVDGGKDKDLEFNADKLTGLLQSIGNLEADEFLPATAAKGFKPTQRVLIRNGKGEVLLDLTWGDEFKAKQGYNKGASLRMVRTSTEKDILGVSAAKINNLVDPALVKKKVPTPTPAPASGPPPATPPGHPPIPSPSPAPPTVDGK